MTAQYSFAWYCLVNTYRKVVQILFSKIHSEIILCHNYRYLLCFQTCNSVLFRRVPYNTFLHKTSIEYKTIYFRKHNEDTGYFFQSAGNKMSILHWLRQTAHQFSYSLAFHTERGRQTTEQIMIVVEQLYLYVGVLPLAIVLLKSTIYQVVKSFLGESQMGPPKHEHYDAPFFATLFADESAKLGVAIAEDNLCRVFDGAESVN